MGKNVRRTDSETKKKTILKIERKEQTIIDAARELGVNPATVSRWIEKWHDGNLVDKPTAREKALEKENQRLKETVGNLYFHIEQLKKTADSRRRMKNEDTSVITADNLDQYLKRAKS